MSFRSLNVKTAPTVEPISLVEAKAHLRVDYTDDDTLITSQIKAVRQKAEIDTKRSFITQTLELRLDSFPCGEIKLLRPQVQSVTSVKYIDTDGVEQTWDSGDYTVDIYSLPPTIYPAYHESYPSTRRIRNAVTIEYIAGYGDAATDVPDNLIAGMKMLLGHLYEHREATIQSAISTKVQFAYTNLTSPFEVFNSD